MCVVSMVGDHYRDTWIPIHPTLPTWPSNPVYPCDTPEVSRAEFEELKRQVAEMVALLKRAKKYDADNHEPDCEVEDKMALLRKVATLVGVDLDAELAKVQA